MKFSASVCYAQKVNVLHNIQDLIIVVFLLFPYLADGQLNKIHSFESDVAVGRMIFTKDNVFIVNYKPRREKSFEVVSYATKEHRVLRNVAPNHLGLQDKDFGSYRSFNGKLYGQVGRRLFYYDSPFLKEVNVRVTDHDFPAIEYLGGQGYLLLNNRNRFSPETILLTSENGYKIINKDPSIELEPTAITGRLSSKDFFIERKNSVNYLLTIDNNGNKVYLAENIEEKDCLPIKFLSMGAGVGANDDVTGGTFDYRRVKTPFFDIDSAKVKRFSIFYAKGQFFRTDGTKANTRPWNDLNSLCQNIPKDDKVRLYPTTAGIYLEIRTNNYIKKIYYSSNYLQKGLRVWTKLNLDQQLKNAGGDRQWAEFHALNRYQSLIKVWGSNNKFSSKPPVATLFLHDLAKGTLKEIVPANQFISILNSYSDFEESDPVVYFISSNDSYKIGMVLKNGTMNNLNTLSLNSSPGGFTKINNDFYFSASVDGSINIYKIDKKTLKISKFLDLSEPSLNQFYFTPTADKGIDEGKENVYTNASGIAIVGSKSEEGKPTKYTIWHYAFNGTASSEYALNDATSLKKTPSTAPNMSTRQGAYDGTIKFKPGTVGYGVNLSIGAIKSLAGTAGQAKIGDFFNRPDVQELLAKENTVENNQKVAELEYEYWQKVRNDPQQTWGNRMGGLVGTMFPVKFRTNFQMGLAYSVDNYVDPTIFKVKDGLNQLKAIIDYRRSLLKKCYPSLEDKVSLEKTPASADAKKELTQTTPQTSSSDYNTLMEDGAKKYQAREYSAALQSFEKALTLKNNQDTLSALYAGISAQFANDIGKTKTYLTTYVNAGGRDVPIFNMLATICSQQGETNRAIDIWEKGLSIYPNNADLTNSLVGSLMIANRVDEAIDRYNKLIAKDPKNARAITNLAIILDNKGDKAGAVRNYEKAVSIDPNQFDALYNLAVYYYNEGANQIRAGETLVSQRRNFEKAITYFERAYKLQTYNCELVKNLNNTYQVLGSFRRAECYGSPPEPNVQKK